MMKIVLSVTCLFVILACPNGTNPELRDEIELGFGQIIQPANFPFSLQFQGVVADSRCPTEVDCVWEGNAEVLVNVISENNSEVYSLNTTLDPQRITHEGYVLELIAVSPYPVYEEDVSEEDYSITLSVDE